MTLISSLYRAFKIGAAPLSGLMVIVVLSTPSVSTGDDITYDNFDVEKFQERYKEIQSPVVTSEDMRALERAFDDAIRRARTQEVAERLRVAAKRWRDLSKQLDEELKAVVEQARKDAKIRSVATFFRLVAATASVVDALASQPTASADGAEPMAAGGTSTHEEGSVQVEETRERAVRVRMNGEWRTIGVEKILRQYVTPPPDTKSPVLQNTFNRLGQLADELPPLACDTKWGGCTAIPSYDDPANATTPVSDTLTRKPTSEESDLLDTVLRFGVDWTPVGDMAAVVTGQDLLTGEKVSRMAAGAGLVVGTVGGPLAKGALKSAQRLWKLGVHKSAMKWVKQFTQRGWTPDKVDEAILKGSRHKAANHVNPKNAATRYEYQGKSVVRDDITKEILHVGDEGFKY